MDEQQSFSLTDKAKVFGAGMVPVAIIDIASKGGGLGLVVGGAAAFILAKYSDQVFGQVRASLPIAASTHARPTGERNMLDRLIGRHYPEQEAEDLAEEWSEEWYDQDEPGPDSSMFTFSQLLATGFRPTLHKIFLGRLSDGTDVFVEAKDLCHVALAGSTGNGKTSLMRLIMAQLCYIRVNVVLLNPHYMVYDRDHDEDWTPYTSYLARNPLDYVKPENIAFMLKWIIDKTLARRMELARAGKSVGKPYFVVIDELPAIVAERKEVASYVAKLLREGRKYGIFLIVASQDFLVKTTGMDAQGGAVRKCFRTACYVGGDITTANVLLEKQEKPIPETDLGKGTMMLRCAATGKAVLASVPYCDNDALYQLLGPSTFRQSEASPVYERDDLGNAETPVSTPVNDAVNGATGSLEPLPQKERLRLLGNAETPEVEHSEAEEASVNVNAETRKLIQRMIDMKVYKHREISKIVGLDGRKYPIYQQVCREMGIATEREA